MTTHQCFKFQVYKYLRICILIQMYWSIDSQLQIHPLLSALRILKWAFDYFSFASEQDAQLCS